MAAPDSSVPMLSACERSPFCGRGRLFGVRDLLGDFVAAGLAGDGNGDDGARILFSEERGKRLEQDGLLQPVASLLMVARVATVPDMWTALVWRLNVPSRRAWAPGTSKVSPCVVTTPSRIDAGPRRDETASAMGVVLSLSGSGALPPCARWLKADRSRSDFGSVTFSLGTSKPPSTRRR